jgi:hypothetical protein
MRPMSICTKSRLWVRYGRIKMMKKVRTIIALLSILFTWNVGIKIADAAPQHNNLAWNGPGTCLQCHESEAADMHGSVHYQWQGQAPFAVSGPPVQGKLNTAVNSYCISILGNWNACGNCHIGLGAKPEATLTRAQLENIDCLLCHQKDYKRKKVAGVFVPDTAAMTITMDQAARTVQLPVRSACLQCHAKGGGGDNNKRGDMTLAHANTYDRNFDVHMATAGANLVCQSCHTSENHRIAGRGSDLRETDLNVQMGCSTVTCHPDKLTASGHESSDINRHIKKVACQTCHIKTYARNASDTAANESTEIYRDWTIPEWSASLNRWEPTITRARDQKPVYQFWNRYSYNYNLNETIAVNPATGKYPTSHPEGGINDPDSKLFPFKYKKALQPIATNLSRLIALDTGVYFATGNVDTSTKQGLINMGISTAEPYAFVGTDTYQLITHETMPSSEALTCNQCHGSSASQMDLKSMGYVIKGPASSVCTQCHGSKSAPGFTTLHNKHVSEKKIDCMKCHGFARASSPPPPTYTLNVVKSGTGSGTVTSSLSGINCGIDCSETYPSGTHIILTAAFQSGYAFSNWSGCNNSSGVTCYVTMESNNTVTANFTTMPSGWNSIPGATADVPALAWNPAANRLQVVVRAADNTIWASTFNSSGTFNNDWINIPGLMADTPALAWNTVTNKLHMVARASDNTLWAATFNSSGTFNNDWAPISGLAASPPALSWNPVSSKFYLVIRASDSTLWLSTFNSSGVFNNDWVNVPGRTASPPALTWNPVANEIQMVVRASDDTMWGSTFSSSGVFNNDWVNIPGQTISPPALVWDEFESKTAMLVRAFDNTIWYSTFSSADNFNNDWINIPGMTVSTPAMAYLPSIGYLEIVVRAADNSLWAILY